MKSVGIFRRILNRTERIGNALPKINFAKMGEAMGIESYRIESMVDFEKINVPEIMSRPGPCILDVIISKSEVPPMGARMKILTGAA